MCSQLCRRRDDFTPSTQLHPSVSTRQHGHAVLPAAELIKTVSPRLSPVALAAAAGARRVRTRRAAVARTGASRGDGRAVAQPEREAGRHAARVDAFDRQLLRGHKALEDAQQLVAHLGHMRLQARRMRLLQARCVSSYMHMCMCM